MLGVFRRHWKPKRTNNTRKTKEKNKDSSDEKSVEVLSAIVVTGHLLKDAEGDDGKQAEFDGETEKSDPVKEPAEQRTVEGTQEKVKKDGLKEQIEREKMLRTEAEAQLREVHLESERCKTRLISLQEDFSRMEEMVYNMLQFKSRIEQLKHEKSSITLAYESKIRKYQSCIASLEKENFMLLNEIRSLQMQKNKDYQDEWEHSLSWLLLERLRLLEQENSSLMLENEQQQLQYEHCLDDVANQVVQALLAQKGLREECAKLQHRVQDLERQNQALGIIFKQCLYHTAENPDQMGKDSLDIWSKSPETHKHEDAWFENTKAYKNSKFQQLNCDSPRNSHSEDSTESLASMCSDYSANSGSSSGNLLSYPGLPKMTSPPQWMKEGICDRRTSRVSPVSFIKNPSCFSNRSMQQKSRFESLSRHLELNRRIECECRNSVPDNSHFRPVKQLTPQNCSDVQKQNLVGERHDWERGRGNISSMNGLSSETGNLDSMETPSDDCLNADTLSLLSSSQRLLVSSQYKPVHNVWAPKVEPLKVRQHKQKLKANCNSGTSGAPCFTSTIDNSAGQNCVHRQKSNIPIPTITAPLHSVSRPTTLNIIPHTMGNSSHSFDFPALEHKDHTANECGNVYEDIDVPLFPESALSCSSSAVSEPVEEENVFTGQMGSSSEEGEITMNTVIRKSHTANPVDEFDSQSTNTQTTGHHPKIPAKELLPNIFSDNFKCNQTFHKKQERKDANETIVLRSCANDTHLNLTVNHISPSANVQENTIHVSVVTEHGSKDEGYSTMSSDVQGEMNTDSMSQLKQACSSPLPVHTSGCISIKSLPDLAEEDRGEVSCTTDSISNCLQSVQPVNVTEDASLAFESELGSSLVHTNKCCKIASSTYFEKGVKAAGEASKQSEHISASESECSLKNNILTHTAGNRLLPTYDKLLTLLTPQGFKSHPRNVRNVTLPLIQYAQSLADGSNTSKCVQTADKATITDPDYLNQLEHSNQLEVNELMNESEIALSLCGNRETNTTETMINGRDSIQNLNFEEKPVRQLSISDHNAVYRNLNDRPKSSIDTYNREHCSLERTNLHNGKHFNSSCCHCSICYEQKSLVQDNTGITHCKCNITRTSSDSQLFVRDIFIHPFELTKAASFNTKHPATGLNVVPLEYHTSACDLSSSLQLTPPLRRSHRQVLVTTGMLATDKQDDSLTSEVEAKKRNSHCSPSLSLSSAHSSTSLETGCVEEDGVNPDLTSESDDESRVLENHNLVEEWLQRDEPQVTFRLENNYTYDEEEIGNWSLQPSSEDVKSIPNTNELWEGHWNSHQEQAYSDKIYIHHLEKIQETNLEDDNQIKFWNTQWHSDSLSKQKKQQQIVVSGINETITFHPIVNEKDHCDITVNPLLPLQTEGVNHESNLQNLKEHMRERGFSNYLPPAHINDDDSCSVNIIEEKHDFNGLQSEATGFNRDFYRLCTLGSTKSLVLSECDGHNEVEHMPENSAENQLFPTEPNLSMEEKEASLNSPINEISVTSTEHADLSTEGLTVLAEKIENDVEKPDSANSQNFQADCKNFSQTTNECNIPQVGKECLTAALAPKRNKIKVSRLTDVKNGVYSAGKHPYSKIMVDKLYIRERTKITATSKRTVPERKKKHLPRSISSKSKVDKNEDQHIKFSKDDLNHSSVKKIVAGKKITRQIMQQSCHEITGCINTAVATLNESKKSCNKKDRRDIKTKNHSVKNSSQIKAKSVKLNEILGLSEKNFEKRINEKQGTVSVADKIQELNALLLNDEKGQSQKMKSKKMEHAGSKDNKVESAKLIQLKEQLTFKKTSIKEGCGTSWVHVEADIDLSDPKARANLLDSMMASSSSSGSEDEGGEDEVLEHKQHERLHALHRFRRHRKRATGKDAAISFIPRVRTSIIDRHDFYFRYGEKEMEAVSCFDFLDDMSTSPSDGGSCEVLGRDTTENNNNLTNHITNIYTDNPVNTNILPLADCDLSSNKKHLSVNSLSSATLNSQDGEAVDHISLSDSCAESYSSSTYSLNQLL